jgi:two-component system response regulator WspF
MRVAIVNDLALATEVLKRLVASVPGCAVAWTAADGAEAVRKAAADLPDVVLMDLVMPVMDGVEATRRIMAATPCPILLVTSSVCGNFNQVYRAMGFGALDAVDTPTLGPGGTVQCGERLAARLGQLRQTGRSAPAKASVDAPSVPPAAGGTPLPYIVALGASTGGPEALATVLANFPADFPACVALVQHIAADFAPGLAAWLQTRCPLPVRPAAEGDPPRAGEVVLAATDDHLILRPDRRWGYTPLPLDNPFRPSVDVFFESLTAHCPRPGAAAVLTGMRDDGGRGLLRLRKAGWETVAQDRATCVVYGMPKAAAELGAARSVLPLARIGAFLHNCAVSAAHAARR